MKTTKHVDALKEELPQQRTEEEKTLFNEVSEAIKSGNAEQLIAVSDKIHALPPELQELAMNATKMRNRTSVLEKTKELTEQLGRFPTKLEVTSATGLSAPTVYKHMNELSAQKHWEAELEMLRMQKSRFLNVIVTAAYKDPKCAKMILDLLNTSFAPAKGDTVINYNTAIQFVLNLPEKDREKFTQRVIELNNNKNQAA